MSGNTFSFKVGDTVMIGFSDGGFQGNITDILEMAGRIFLVYVNTAPKCVQYHQNENKWVYGQYGIDPETPCTVRKL